MAETLLHSLVEPAPPEQGDPLFLALRQCPPEHVVARPAGDDVHSLYRFHGWLVENGWPLATPVEKETVINTLKAIRQRLLAGQDEYQELFSKLSEVP